MRALTITALLAVSLTGVCEANNPMPMPDYDEICRINCGGPEITLEGFLWAAGIVAFFAYIYFAQNK